MTAEILRPELLTITDEKTDKAFFGGFQEWYKSEWHRNAGCGPTCAANVLAYLALTRPELRSLYAYETMSLSNFAQHMEEIYRFVTPGNMGLNKAEMFTEGVVQYAKSRGISLTPYLFDVPGNMARNRAPVSELAAFVKAGLESDCPIGFLNLTKGKVKNIQGWHWITVFKADIDDNNLITCASDEGKEICFDLRLWYLSTRMRGGLAYFTQEKG
jgi:hypothetical protein